MKVMLLAAGEGTRFRPHTLRLPKPALPFLNIPLGYYTLRWIDELKPEGFVVNTFHLPSEIHKVFNKIKPRLKNLEFSNEKEKILGSGGGLGHAKKFFAKTETILLANADEVFFPMEEKILARALQQHKDNKALATLIVIEHPEVGQQFGGIWVDANRQVIGFGKKEPVGAVKGYHYIGVCLLNQKVFDLIPEGESNILHDVLIKALNDSKLSSELNLGKVQIFNTRGVWFETGNLESYLDATRESLNLLTQKLEPVDEMARAQRYLFDVTQEFAPDSELYQYENGTLWSSKSASPLPHTSVSGFAVVGEGAKMPRSVRLENAVVGAGVQLEDFESIDSQLKL
jgi:mannose-1-phosphate guanylyltransferase